MEFEVDEEIRLKELDLSVVENIFTTIDSERSYLEEWLPFVETTKKQEDTAAFVESVMHAPADRKEIVTAIFYQGLFAGVIGFKSTDRQNRKTELGYWLSEKFQGCGIVTRACRKLVRFAFEDLGMNRIQIKVAVRNFRSQRIPRRLHFVEEGIERNGELLKNGFTDLIVYSLLAKEYFLSMRLPAAL